MPNWCSTIIDFIGDRSDIEDLYNKIELYTSKRYQETYFGNNWLGNILYGFGLGDNIDELENLQCRGIITGKDNIEYSGSLCRLRIWTETAEVPMIKMWNVIIEKYYGGRISVHWIAEELASGLYETNDYDRYSFDTYKVDLNLGDDCCGDYWDTVEEAVGYINDNLKWAGINKVITADEITDDGLYIEFDNGYYISVNILKEVSDDEVD